MVQARKYTFPGDERLKSTALINGLFTHGKSCTSYPLKIFWDFTEPDDHSSPVRAGFSVPKKNFKRAVDRNLIKRRLREAYRLNKYILYDLLTDEKRQLFFMILYLPKKIMDYNELQEGIRRLLDTLCHTLNENNE